MSNQAGGTGGLSKSSFEGLSGSMAAGSKGVKSGSSDSAGARPARKEVDLDVILDVPLRISVELGETRMVINDLIKLSQGSVIELTKAAGETLDIMANRRLIAKGEVVVVNDRYGVRVTEIRSPADRIEELK